MEKGNGRKLRGEKKAKGKGHEKEKANVIAVPGAEILRGLRAFFD